MKPSLRDYLGTILGYLGGSFGTTVFNEVLVGFLPEAGFENNNALVVSFFWAYPLVCALGFQSFSLNSWLSLLLREMQKVAEMDRPETRHFVQKCVSQFLPINNLWTGLLALAGPFLRRATNPSFILFWQSNFLQDLPQSSQGLGGVEKVNTGGGKTA